MGLMTEMGGTAVAVAEGVAAATVAADGAGGAMGVKVPGTAEAAVGMEVITRPGADKVGAAGTEAGSGGGEVTGTGAEGDSEAVGCDGSGLWGFGRLGARSFWSVSRTSWRLYRSLGTDC